jgi:hypothetical protein
VIAFLAQAGSSLALFSSEAETSSGPIIPNASSYSNRNSKEKVVTFLKEKGMKTGANYLYSDTSHWTSDGKRYTETLYLSYSTTDDDFDLVGLTEGETVTGEKMISMLGGVNFRWDYYREGNFIADFAFSSYEAAYVIKPTSFASDGRITAHTLVKSKSNFPSGLDSGVFTGIEQSGEEINKAVIFFNKLYLAPLFA